jgi:hypothetical protein
MRVGLTWLRIRKSVYHISRLFEKTQGYDSIKRRESRLIGSDAKKQLKNPFLIVDEVNLNRPSFRCDRLLARSTDISNQTLGRRL